MRLCKKCGKRYPSCFFPSEGGAACAMCQLRHVKLEYRALKNRERRRREQVWKESTLRRLIYLMPLAPPDDELERWLGLPAEECRQKAMRLGIGRPRYHLMRWSHSDLYQLWFLRRKRHMSFSEAAAVMFKEPEKERDALIGAWHRHIKGKEKQFELVFNRRHSLQLDDVA